MHLTDLKIYNSFDLVVRVKLDAGKQHIRKFGQILSLLFDLADHLASSRYSVPLNIQTKL